MKISIDSNDSSGNHMELIASHSQLDKPESNFLHTINRHVDTCKILQCMNPSLSFFGRYVFEAILAFSIHAYVTTTLALRFYKF